MISNYLKIFLILIVFFFSNEAKSKTTTNNDFDPRELSNYLSAIISQDNENNEESLKYFKSSKNLKNKHNEYFEKYIYSLVLNQNVKSAIQEIKIHKNTKKTNFFASYLLLAVDSMQKKNYQESNFYLDKLSRFRNIGTFETIIYESLKNYVYAFENKKIIEKKSSYQNLSNLHKAFINCYLNSNETNKSFEILINSEKVDYSRYLFFYITYLIENNKIIDAKNLINEFDEFNSILLVLQSKIWLEKNELNNFTKIFSCKNENDLLAEFFFLIANLYSTQEDLETSNFYLSLAEYLNEKFRYNLSLMAENYFTNENFKQTKKILSQFHENDEIFYWHRIKKITSIISKEQNDEEALRYVENKYSKINKNNKIIFDMANIYKGYKKYEEAINLYSILLDNIDSSSSIYADLLYRRGGSYERIGKYDESDKDLNYALKILPDNSYILNYLAYSWLERDVNIDKAVSMLEVAYKKDQDNPYIIDSVGWAYYLTERYIEAEQYMRKAITLMPNDPIVNDHYGDILWSLDKKIQAKYYWNSVLNSNDTDEDMREKVKNKLLLGPKKNNES